LTENQQILLFFEDSFGALDENTDIYLKPHLGEAAGSKNKMQKKLF
jgi:hypothetical protein